MTTPTSTPIMPTFNNLYLGNHVFVDSNNKKVDLGESVIKHITDATDDQDVPSFAQVKRLDTLITGKLDDEIERATTSEDLLRQKTIIDLNLVPSVSVVGGQAYPEHIPSTRFASLDGWFYRNSDPSTVGKKINWYITVPPNTKFKDLKYLCFNAFIYSNISIPFINFYTAPKVGGAASWYGAKQCWEIANPPDIEINRFPENPTAYQFYAQVNPDEYGSINGLINPGLQQKQLTMSTVASSNVGTISDDDIVYLVAISTNSNATINTVDCLINAGCVVTTSGSYVSNMSNDYASTKFLENSIDTEELKRAEEDTKLTNKILKLYRTIDNLNEYFFGLNAKPKLELIADDSDVDYSHNHL